MSERQHNEKYEKEEEKAEKEHEKDEKSWDEKWRRDPLTAAGWAAILIWAGLVLLADNLGFLTRFERMEAWALIFIGAGLIVLLGVVIRLVVPEYRRPVTGSLILGAVLLAIGLGDLLGTDLVWALVLIAIGVAVLLRGFLWRR
jgi:low affinity Fe/Cu permease